MQLFRVQPKAPPELPLTVQLFSVAPTAAPPELPIRAQLLSVLLDATEPELPVRIQLLTMPPDAPPAPLVNVNPERLELPVSAAHQFNRPPSIKVTSGPLTLRTDRRSRPIIGA